MTTPIMNKEKFLLKDKHIFILECFLILLFSLFPLIKTFPFTSTIYLSWEGAYRLYLGQIPFKDFGLPMGFGYWLIPAIFFKIFGPYLATLIKAQAFINIISAFAFRSIMKSFRVSPPLRLLGIFLFLISYVYINPWPWYNHTVIVFELIGMAFLLKYILKENKKFRMGYLFGGAFFIFLAFFTKQDGGALALLIGLTLIILHSIYERNIRPVLWFLGFYLLIGICFFVPFLPYQIGFWFNYGQPPHYDRISFYEIINIFFSQSTWIKFYILVIVILLLLKFRRYKQFISNKKEVLFTIFTLGILFEAAVIQVTSYVPENGNIFFHSFAIVYIATFAELDFKIQFRKPFLLGAIGLFILLWWSPFMWGYANSYILKHFPGMAQVDSDEISIRTYSLSKKKKEENIKMVVGPWKQFKGVSLPEKCITGIQEVLNLKVVKEKGENIRFLNMSELTPLESILGYVPETGSNIPLWYHKNVGMFDNQLNMYNTRIENGYYDLILFEYYPTANNFYPFEIRDQLKKYYQQVDHFPIPRKFYIEGDVEVYVKKTTP